MSTSFIKWLDEYHDKKDMTQFDYSIMTTLINRHFTGSFQGDFLDTQTSCFTPNPPAQYTNTLYNDPYYLWQRQYEFFDTSPLSIDEEQDHEKKDKHAIIEKVKATIESTVETLSDLINIIDQNPVNDNCEYNIDLKSLHKIRPELVQLNNMIGLTELKKSVLDQLLYFAQNLCLNDFKHTALFGPPGTGKTEVAKIIGKMYSKIGILKNDIFKKVTRNDLVAGYLGQTAIKTRKVIDESLGGVLFIDEAYSLASPGDTNDSYSKECIDTLCEALSHHKEDLMVIIAGYEEELNQTFFKVNKGMPSRFVWRFTMEPYSPKEMMNIFIKLVGEQGWLLESDQDKDRKTLDKWFEEKKDDFIYYGRDMELLVTYTKIAHSRRIYGKAAELRKIITSDDLNAGHKMFLKNKKEKKDQHYLYGLYV
jgi:SpoVK/Ycf46/Vps4 family AAA+-type ATPase